MGGKKNDDPASPAYIPTLFHHVKSPAKRKAMRQLDRYECTKISKKRRSVRNRMPCVTWLDMWCGSYAINSRVSLIQRKIN